MNINLLRRLQHRQAIQDKLEALRLDQRKALLNLFIALKLEPSRVWDVFR